MLNIFFGFIFIFFKANLNFWDIGAIYYLTNIVGYISIFWGIKELGRRNPSLLKIKPYIIFMLFHSIVFFFLNITGNSPLTIALSTSLGTIISLIGAGLIVMGMFMAFIIIFLLVEALNAVKAFDKKRIYNLTSLMILTFILAGASAILNINPLYENTLMGVLLLLEVFFLLNCYNAFFAKGVKLT